MWRNRTMISLTFLHQMLFFQLIELALTQTTCKPDLLVDDFRRANLSRLVIETPPPLRYFNLIGGDYGSKAANITYNPEPISNMDILAEQGEPDTSESDTHPGAPTGFNYWYVKFDLNACFDLTGYDAMEFDMESPSVSDFYIALTQRSSDCSRRLIDSVYTKLSDYITPNGRKQTVRVPLSDFAKNLVGQDFQFRYLKDVTFINLIPAGASFKMSNFWLRGCRNSTTTTGSNSDPTGSTPSTTAQPSPTKSSFATKDAPLALLLLLGLFL